MSDHVRSALGFEDDSGITSEINLQLDEGHFTGTRITICNGMNGPHCVEPIDVFQKQRDPRYKPAPGDADEEKAEEPYVYPSFL